MRDCVQFFPTAPHICEYQARRDDGSVGTDLVAFVRVGVEQNALTGTLFQSGLIFGLPSRLPASTAL
jgi:hypothetical protein